MTRSCLFCGGHAATKEHVFAEWLRDDLPVKVSRINVSDDEYRPIWSLGSFDLEYKIVCGQCNHGWMSKLESAAAPLLSDAIVYGAPVTLSAAQQHSVAMWAVKTAMVLEAYRRRRPFRYIPEWHARWMSSERDPPAHTTVWMFARLPDFRPEGIPDFVFMRSFGIVDKEPPQSSKAYISTFAVGHVGFQVFGANGRLDQVPLGLQPTPFLQERTIRLWPNPAASVRWPPPRVMHLDEIKRFAQWDQPDPIPRAP